MDNLSNSYSLFACNSALLGLPSSALGTTHVGSFLPALDYLSLGPLLLMQSSSWPELSLSLQDHGQFGSALSGQNRAMPLLCSVDRKGASGKGPR